MKKKRTPPIFDAWTARYDSWFETSIGTLVKKYESDLLLKLLNPLPGEKILDAGCGTGIFTVDMLAFGSRITGIDISEAMLRKAVDKTSSAFTGLCADMCALPFADNSFDKVLSMTALEFIEDANSAVMELNRVTKKGGTIVLTTLNRLSPWAERRLQKARRGHSLFQKIFFRSPDDMRFLVPGDPVVKTAIHFQKEDSLLKIPEIERQGNKKQSDKGAFLAVQWNKT